MVHAYSFTPQSDTASRIMRCERQAAIDHTFSYRLRSKFDDDRDECGNFESGIPQLPATGSSSFHNRLPTISVERDNAGAAFVSPKFELQYTCKVCNTRNCHLVSRIGKCKYFLCRIFHSPSLIAFANFTAYREGVVITVCKGCESKHMIADNLGSGCLDGDANIEDYFKARGMEDIVNRVSQEVFELEKILNFDNLIGDDGNAVLE